MKSTIDMAREAGLHRQQHNLMSNPIQYRYSYDGYEENLKAFEALVRADAIADVRERLAKIQFESILQAMKIEREACAKVAEDFLTSGRSPLGRSVAAAIRARGETKNG